MSRVGYIPHRDPRLGRHVNHDPRSRAYPYRRTAPLTSIRHQAHIPILDQLRLGSCTGNAGIQCLGRGRFFVTITSTDRFHDLNEADAVALYSAATAIDPFVGVYPPEDTGSDGLSVAKVLHDAGEIAGYQWAFSLDQALAALMDRPVITGVNWYTDMFTPNWEGLIHPTGSLAGGHEIVVDEYIADRGWVGFSNSWGVGWGASGRFYMEAEEYGHLLGQDGDVTIFTPSPEPPPQPEYDADRDFAVVLHEWLAKRRYFYKPVQVAAQTWLESKGL